MQSYSGFSSYLIKGVKVDILCDPLAVVRERYSFLYRYIVSYERVAIGKQVFVVRNKNFRCLGTDTFRDLEAGISGSRKRKLVGPITVSVWMKV